MPRFAANLSTMYGELPFLERFGAAAKDGFRAVEFLFPYAHPPAALAAELARHGLRQVLFNTVPGDFDAGERGLAAVPGREAEFLDGVDRAIDFALALGCPNLHAMSGRMPDGADPAHWHATAVANLREAARRCAVHGITLLIEPLNTRDNPGYFLTSQAQAHALLDAVGAPNLRVQLDLYHCQIMEGDLATHVREGLPRVGHVQIAGVPGRHEPDVGEIHYPYLFELLDALGYAGWVGCEYRPRAGTRAGLGWAKGRL
jgi:hydroxypyruvate isomerase